METDDGLRPTSSGGAVGLDEAVGGASAASCESTLAAARSALSKVPRKGILKKKMSADTSFDQNASLDNTPIVYVSLAAFLQSYYIIPLIWQLLYKQVHFRFRFKKGS